MTDRATQIIRCALDIIDAKRDKLRRSNKHPYPTGSDYNNIYIAPQTPNVNLKFIDDKCQ